MVVVVPCTWKIEIFALLDVDDSLNLISHCTSINFCGLYLWILGSLWEIEIPWSADVGIVMRRINNGHGSDAMGDYCMPTVDHPRHYCSLTFSMVG
jgi:hypothetical protein